MYGFNFMPNVQNIRVMDPISIGLGAVGLASSLFGAAKGAKANKEAAGLIDKQEAENEAFYNNNVNRDFLETNAAKGVVEQIRKRYQDKVKQIDTTQAATGGTAEAAIAEKTALNESEGDAINSIAQKATGYQLANEGQYRQGLSDLYRQRMSLNRAKAENASNLSGVGANLLGTAASVAGLDTENLVKGASGSFAMSDDMRANMNNIAKTGTNKILND